MQGHVSFHRHCGTSSGVATARIRGEFGAASYARLRDDLLWTAPDRPWPLVLDPGISGNFGAQLITAVRAGHRPADPAGPDDTTPLVFDPASRSYLAGAPAAGWQDRVRTAAGWQDRVRTAQLVAAGGTEGVNA